MKAEQQADHDAEIDAMEGSWPRALIAEGRSRNLSIWWVESRANSIREEMPPFARHSMSAPISEAFFDVRRARRLVRGLEASASKLAEEQAGLMKTAATQTADAAVRISRLLVVSRDGSPRFFREVEKLQKRFANRLEVLVLDCDQEALGEAGFGPGKQARAVLIDHKTAVVRFLALLDEVPAD